MQSNHQAGFYMLETLLSVMIFFTACLTLLPIQYQLLIEKKMIREDEKATYFLSKQIHKVWLGEEDQRTEIYEDIISTPLIVTITRSDSLIEGCVSWNNVKQKQTTKCQYATPQ